MPTRPVDDAMLDELLPLVRVSPEAAAARRWLNDALMAARGTVEPQLTVTSATRVPKPSPARHNAPLKKIERAAARLDAALEQLRHHPYAHGGFWRFGIVAQTVPLPRRLALALARDPRAVRIGRVEPGGPVATAGLREGDILLSLDGIAIAGTDDLVRLLGGDSVGREMSLVFMRDGSIERAMLWPSERVGQAKVA
jgi:predicted metalloprotease with PDZ domain